MNDFLRESREEQGYGLIWAEKAGFSTI